MLLFHWIMFSPNYQVSTSGKGSETRNRGEVGTSTANRHMLPRGWGPCLRWELLRSDGGGPRRETLVPLQPTHRTPVLGPGCAQQLLLKEFIIINKESLMFWSY